MWSTESSSAAVLKLWPNLIFGGLYAGIPWKLQGILWCVTAAMADKVGHNRKQTEK